MKPRIELNAHSVYDAMDSVISIKELVEFAKRNHMPAIALTDLNCVQGFPEFERECKKAGIKPIYGAQIIHGTYQEEYPFTSTVLVKNQVGLKNLYHILSELKNDGVCKNVPVHVMERYHDGLLFGANKFDFDMANEKMAALLDYVEVDHISLCQKEEAYNSQILKDAKAIDKPVVAVSKAKCIGEDGKLCRRILREGEGFETDGTETGYLRTCEDMLDAFSYLGEDTEDVVINNPLKIAEQIEEVQIIPFGYENRLFGDAWMPFGDGLTPFDDVSKLSGDAFETMRKFAENFAANRYGKIVPRMIPAEIGERLETELRLHTAKWCADELLLSRYLVNSIRLFGGVCNISGTAASSFLAYCLRITDINPLPPHYYCPECKTFDWVKDACCGADLPDKTCTCGGRMRGDGMNIPYESFFGFKGDKIPDIDIKCDREAHDTVLHTAASDFLKENPIAVAGTVSTVSELRARKMIAEYEEKTGKKFDDPQKEKLIEKLTTVKQSDGIHPSGFFIIPKGKGILDFTPVREERTQGFPITHFDFSALWDTVYKCDVLPAKHLDLLRELERITGVQSEEIPLNSPEIFSVLKTSGKRKIPGLDHDFSSQAVCLTKPKRFSDLVKIIGLAHGTGTWYGNAAPLLKNGVCALSDLPATREDIYNGLLSRGLDKVKAFRYAETVRKGLIAKGRLSDEEIKEFEEDLTAIGMPDWYAGYCKNIRYLCPKAHACELAKVAVIEAWYLTRYETLYEQLYRRIIQ